MESRISDQTAGRDRLQYYLRKNKSDHTACQRDENILDNKLPHQCPGGCAECFAHADRGGALHYSADIDIDQIDRGQQQETYHHSYQQRCQPLWMVLVVVGELEQTGDGLKEGLGATHGLVINLYIWVLHAGQPR